MPDMNGFALAARVTSLHPETRVLFITGYAADRREVKATLQWTPHAFLLKPFTSTALRQKVEYVLLTRDGVSAAHAPTAARFSQALAVRYRPADQTAWLRGRTINVSNSGVLLAAVSALALGSRLDLAFQPTEAVGSLGSGMISRHGRVVRHGTPTTSIRHPVAVEFIVE